ncbi:MAG: hypothetical protein HFJ55_07870, partial [Clostridia bacterium]|nr:hypothetical protein [Clostridia bacterium]
TNGATETVALTVEMLSNYTATTLEEQTLTVTYEGKTTTINVTLTNPVESIELDENASVTGKYGTAQEDLTVAGNVIATKADGTTETVALTAEMLSNYTATTLEEQTLTVTYAGKTTTINVTLTNGIKSIVLNSIAGETVVEAGDVKMVTLPYNTQVMPMNVNVTVTMDDGSKPEVTITKVSNYDPTKAEVAQEVTIEGTSVGETFEIVVRVTVAKYEIDTSILDKLVEEKSARQEHYTEESWAEFMEVVAVARESQTEDELEMWIGYIEDYEFRLKPIELTVNKEAGYDLEMTLKVGERVFDYDEAVIPSRDFEVNITHYGEVNMREPGRYTVVYREGDRDILTIVVNVIESDATITAYDKKTGDNTTLEDYTTSGNIKTFNRNVSIRYARGTIVSFVKNGTELLTSGVDISTLTEDLTDGSYTIVLKQDNGSENITVKFNIDTAAPKLSEIISGNTYAPGLAIKLANPSDINKILSAKLTLVKTNVANPITEVDLKAEFEKDNGAGVYTLNQVGRYKITIIDINGGETEPQTINITIK